MKIVTHDDRFHADDVCAMATLIIALGDQITEVVRTRDEQIIQSADIVFDVGNVYDPTSNRFDHHQVEGAGTRENGVPYASFGLVWKKWGEHICGSQVVADMVDQKIVQPIDAHDNGYAFVEYLYDDVREYSINSICASFGATWKEQDRYDEAFMEVVHVLEKIIRREIKNAQDKAEAIPLVEAMYERAQDKRIVVLDEYYPWSDTLQKYTEILYVISPNKQKTIWRINATQDSLFVNRKDLPQEWAGLRDADLVRVSGVEGAIFCHRKLFMAAATTKESALLLAKKAIES